MSVRVALGAGVVALLLALAFVLADSERRQAGSNYVPEITRVVMLRGADRHCQEGQLVPGDAAALRLLVGTYGRPTPRLEVSVRAGGSKLTSGTLPAGREQGHLVVPLERVERTTPNARVCVGARAARGRRTVLYGTLGQVRFEWLRAGRESWLELLPTLAHRFGLGRAEPLGPWLLPLTILLLLTAVIGALRLGMRELEA